MATAHTHSHAEHEGDALIAEARRSLENQGERWTGMRAEVFEELAKHSRPVSAYDIAENLSNQRGSRVAPNSVYRILDIFVRKNLANRIESANAFLVNSHPGCRHDCIFLICDDCGGADHVDDDRLTGALRSAGQQAGYSDVRPVIELRGLCAECSK
ncbi:MAG: transcriptional repressor [Erythrobacter sp.]|nr:transcriptional repressor [Erythrobacter sp.]NCQ64411.1 transcriptional repressor [Alphaproteobacteria bacterium]